MAQGLGLVTADFTRVWPSSLATSGPRKRSESIEMSNRRARPLLEDRGVHVLDRRSALETLAMLIDHLGILREQRRDGLRVSGVVRARERVSQRADRLLILGPVGQCGPRPADVGAGGSAVWLAAAAGAHS